jgi:hypothetical protein
MRKGNDAESERKTTCQDISNDRSGLQNKILASAYPTDRTQSGAQHTALILLLIPYRITSHILRLVVLLVSTTTKHLVKEAELRVCLEREEGKGKDEEEKIKKSHGDRCSNDCCLLNFQMSGRI